MPILSMEFSAELLIKGGDLSEPEQKQLAMLLQEPVYRKWLQIMAANCIKEHWEIPLSTLAEDGPHVTSIKQSFVKGKLSIITTQLNYFETPVTVQAPR